MIAVASPARRRALLCAGVLAAALPGCATLQRLGQSRGQSQSQSNQPAPSSQIRSADLQKAQLFLQQQGRYDGQVDGIDGPATQAAMRLYQQSQNLPQSGQLDSATAAAMHLSTRTATETANTPMADGSRMTEAEARRLIEGQGFTNITGLYRDDSAVWRGVATRGGKTGEVAINAQGQVVTN